MWAGILTAVVVGLGSAATTSWIFLRQTLHRAAVRQAEALVQPLLDSRPFDEALQRIDEHPSSVAADPVIVALRKRASEGIAVNGAVSSAANGGEKPRNDEPVRTELPASANAKTFGGLLAAIKACDLGGDIKPLYDEALKLSPDDSARKQVEAAAANWRQAREIKIAEGLPRFDGKILVVVYVTDDFLKGLQGELAKVLNGAEVVDGAEVVNGFINKDEYKFAGKGAILVTKDGWATKEGSLLLWDGSKTVVPGGPAFERDAALKNQIDKVASLIEKEALRQHLTKDSTFRIVFIWSTMGGLGNQSCWQPAETSILSGKTKLFCFGKAQPAPYQWFKSSEDPMRMRGALQNVLQDEPP